MPKNKFIMVDGLDGCGKGKAIEALRDLAHSKKLKTFDLKTYWKDYDIIPTLQDIGDAEVIISAEPTYALVGKGIREEIIKDNKREYSAQSTAFAFSLDREILYRRLLIPALKAGKIVFQERGIVTSIVYQPVQGNISLNEVINLPGNRLALQNAPGLVIIPKLSAKTAMARLKGREKKDDAIFENLPFQEKLKERFESEWLQTLLKNNGSKVEYIDNEHTSVDEFKSKVAEVVAAFLKF
ncbi:MAG TPA: hypothetical protein VJB90_02575 [Candidatus Nanoarchaeia archaeon]|nr:hypothetical protein [Candidatus Nanoarchaeia archaeon]